MVLEQNRFFQHFEFIESDFAVFTFFPVLYILISNQLSRTRARERFKIVISFFYNWFLLNIYEFYVEYFAMVGRQLWFREHLVRVKTTIFDEEVVNIM